MSTFFSQGITIPVAFLFEAWLKKPENLVVVIGETVKLSALETHFSHWFRTGFAVGPVDLKVQVGKLWELYAESKFRLLCVMKSNGRSCNWALL